MYLECPSFDNCEYYVFNNTFTKNSASFDGGAIKWIDIEPYNWTNNTYNENSAVYGNEIASFPITLQRINATRNLQST